MPDDPKPGPLCDIILKRFRFQGSRFKVKKNRIGEY
jgi:hypothetical protein